MLWENLKVQDFPAAVEASKGVCVIPLGAMEKHGLHLAVGMDTIAVEEVARRAAEIEPVVVFPSFHFGNVNVLQNFAGSICLSNRLVMDYMMELCREIARSGFKKILFFNGHGGNPFLFQTICTSMAEQKRDYVVSFVNYYNNTSIAHLQKAIHGNPDAFSYLTASDVQVIDDYCAKPMEAGHACFEETLLLLGIRPDAVDLSMMDKEDGRSTHKTDHLSQAGIYNTFNWFANHPNSHQASYHPGANERLGRAMLQHYVNEAVKTFRIMKEDQSLLAFSQEWNTKW